MRCTHKCSLKYPKGRSSLDLCPFVAWVNAIESVETDRVSGMRRTGPNLLGQDNIQWW